MDAVSRAAESKRAQSGPLCAVCGSDSPIALDRTVPLCDECLGPTPAVVLEEPRTQPARVRSLQA
jgi:hypothetical protein